MSGDIFAHAQLETKVQTMRATEKAINETPLRSFPGLFICFNNFVRSAPRKSHQRVSGEEN
jgi:hypothetical protein